MASVMINKSRGTAESDIQEELDGAVRNKVVFTEISERRRIHTRRRTM